MTSTIALLTPFRALAFAAALLASSAVHGAQGLPCPENKAEIGAGLCPDGEGGTKRVSPGDTDQSNTEKAGAPADTAATGSVGREDKAEQETRTEQRKERIDLLAREAAKPFK